ncbi:MAG: bifunctional heptose 7-phosphate kinase/heptose 1-phosphate adenyltransferase [Synergistaceae bacterium]|jgi:D-beta-D-heptose 7-phosphate kinase/D-beta-D-heptose 1-phosphate adenosyltransferase|nr:bifunctional heptose 7-phosphate kinase/heptose 1-phosphate adenyltransferase [Synergistaceae bacterium]
MRDFLHRCVAVLGDVVLDRYIEGTTSRVSREAPIPVVVCGSERDNLGGAGNVAMNLRGLGCQVFLMGRVGRDHAASRVRAHLEAGGIEAELFEHDGPTLTKTRLICEGQQVARFDREGISEARADKDDVRVVVSILDGVLAQGVSTLILSDYGLGFCSPAICRAVIERCASLTNPVPVLIDPRGSDWEKYRGAAGATPNLAELSAAVGYPVPNEDGAVAQAGAQLRRTYGMDWLLLTRSASGMTLIEKENGPVHIPARRVEVFDVSGAGDTVIACMAASGSRSVLEAARFANEAAQIVVTRAGTYPITASDLEHKPQNTAPIFGLNERDKAVRACREWRDAGLRVVFTNGCFDLFHAGHAASLTAARALGDKLIVGLNSDASVRRIKGPHRPVNREADRAAVLASMRAVDAVVVFGSDTPEALLSELRPNVLAKGGDYKADELPGREYAEEVVILPLVDGLSSSAIIEAARRR